MMRKHPELQQNLPQTKKKKYIYIYIYIEVLNHLHLSLETLEKIKHEQFRIFNYIYIS